MKTSTMKQNKAVIQHTNINKHGLPDTKCTPNQKVKTQNRNNQKTKDVKLELIKII